MMLRGPCNTTDFLLLHPLRLNSLNEIAVLLHKSDGVDYVAKIAFISFLRMKSNKKAQKQMKRMVQLYNFAAKIKRDQLYT